MIFNLVMKTPDAAECVLENLVAPYCTPEEKDKAKQMLSSILEYGEFLTVQCDTKDESFREMIKDRAYQG